MDDNKRTTLKELLNERQAELEAERDTHKEMREAARGQALPLALRYKDERNIKELKAIEKIKAGLDEDDKWRGLAE